MNRQDFTDALVTHLRDFASSILIADRQQVTASATTIASMISDVVYGQETTTTAGQPPQADLAHLLLKTFQALSQLSYAVSAQKYLEAASVVQETEATRIQAWETLTQMGLLPESEGDNG